VNKGQGNVEIEDLQMLVARLVIRPF